MQENLDVIISFVVVIIGVSMLLQIIMEMIKNGFKLRWSTYESFLLDIYRKEFISTNAGPTGRKLKNLIKEGSAEVQGVVSQKIGSVQGRIKALSDKVNALATNIQTLKKVLLDLQTGLSNPDRLAANLSPLGQQATTAIAALKAVNIESLFSIYLNLRRVVDGKNGDIKNVADATISRASQTESSTGSALTQAKTEGGIGDVGLKPQDIGDFIKALGEASVLFETLLSDQKVLAEVKADTVKQILLGIKSVEDFLIHYKEIIVDRVDGLLQDLEYQYNRRVAVWTFFVGLALVIALNADSVLIYRTLKSEPAVRAAVTDQAKTLSQNTKAPSWGEQIAQLSEEASKIKKVLSAKGAAGKVEPTTLDSFVVGFTALAKGIEAETKGYNEPKKEAAGTEKRVIVLPFEDLSKGDLSISIGNFQKQIKGGSPLDGEAKKKLQVDLDSAIRRLTENELTYASSALRNQKELLFSTDLPLGWTPERWHNLWNSWQEWLGKLAGLFLSAFLISFGAPFWNDVLSSLFGLKNFLTKPVKEKIGGA